MIPKKERALAFLAPVFPSSRKRLINITSLVRVGFTMRAEDSNLSCLSGSFPPPPPKKKKHICSYSCSVKIILHGLSIHVRITGRYSAVWPICAVTAN